MMNLNQVHRRTAQAALAVLVAGGLTVAHAAKPYTEPDDAEISLTGRVAVSSAAAFVLDYGEGIITVEMDGHDWYGEGHLVAPGEQVTVWGDVDKDFFELRSIEAERVYVKGSSTIYHASDADEEGGSNYFVPELNLDAADGSWMSVAGRITDLDGREFTLSIGGRSVRIDTSEMGYDPTDKVGVQRIQQGDYVVVSGWLDKDLFETNEMLAKKITLLFEEPKV